LLKPIELPELEYLYTSKPLEPGPALAANRRDEINQSLTRLADSDPLVRFTPLQDDSRIMALTCRTREQLQEAVQIIEDDWARPVRCRTFVARLVEMRLGIDESEKPLSLIVAASLEEVHMDVARANERIFWWALLLCAGAAGLALLSAMVMTRPLARLTEASRRLAEGDYSVDLPLRGGGEIEKLTRAFRHMTEQIRQRDAAVRDTLARMQAVLRTAADGIITFNERGIIEEYNQAAEKMFGYRAEEIRGRKVQQLIDVHDLPDHSGQPAVESSSVLWISKIVNTPNVVRRGCRKDGSTFWMEAAFSELSLGQRRLITAIFRDITRRVEDEEQIRQMTERLEARVRLRTTELEDAKGKLEVALKVAQAANRAKDEFIRFVSHELRTPLSSIMGFTQLLLNPRATRLLENPVPTLRKILESSEHLLALVNDLLDVARATAGKPIELNITEFDLDPFLNGVIEMTRPLLAKNANELVPAVPQGLGAMRSDETRVRQILLNLLSNACKFTEKGRIRLEVRPEDDWVVFTVADTGCGMTPEQLHNLFTPFYRVDSSTTRKTPGTGLGLSISKILCDQMGGSIEVSSVPGQGTTFIVRLPVQVREDGSARTGPSPGVLPAPAAQVAPLHKDTVLVIDDDPLTRELMESFLQREGFHVQAAPSGEDGVRLAREIRPGVITLDVLMPGFDGWAVLTALKSDPRTHDIPVVMLTIVDDRTRGYTLGASDYLTKPIDWDRLNAVLRRYCPEPASLLVVDDDELQRDHLSQSLAQAGWTVRLAGNGREALSLIDAEMPDLILLDLILPEMDGFQFLEELRGRPGGQTVPVIIVTAKDLTRNDLERLRGRVTQILRKGIVSREDLLARIRNYIHGASG
jgi:PAS domain S-box-containing protein